MCTFMYTHINMNLVWCVCMCACGCVCVCRWAPLCVDLWRPEKDISVHSLSSHYSLKTSSLAGPGAPSSCAMWVARCHGVPPPAGTWATGVWDCAGRLKSSRSEDSCPPSHPSALEYFKLVSHPMTTKIEARSFCTSIQALGWSSQVFKSEVKHEAGRSGRSSLGALLLPWGSPNPTLWAHREHFVSCVHCGRHFAVFLECVLHEVSVCSKWNTRIPAALKRMDFSKFLGHIDWVLTAAMVAVHGAHKYPELRGRRLGQVLKWRHQWPCWVVWVGKQ